MVTKAQTISDLQAEISGSLQALQRFADAQLPSALLALGNLSPPTGMVARVAICYPNGRQIRCDADAAYFDFPGGCKVVISVEEASESPSERHANIDARISADPPGDDRMRDLVLALNAAEHDRQLFPNFVALKTFRDKVLLERGLSWAASLEARHAGLSKAIADGYILTNKVPNPKSPSFPVTGLRLNRSHQTVMQILSRTEENPSPFAPITLRGDPLSATVIRERR